MVKIELMVKKFIVDALEKVDGWLDCIPSHEEGRWYRYGCWGCRMGLAAKSAQLDEKWGTDRWGS